MAMNFRMLPPAAGATNSPANGRSYSCAAGSALDVPDFDAEILGAGGWIKAALSGTTAQRPSTNYAANPPYVAAPGLHFIDTTLSLEIVFDGTTWRNPITGASV